MANDMLQLIKQEKIMNKDFNLYGDSDNPLFLVKDVAEMIDYDVKNSGQMVKNLDENDDYLISPLYYMGQIRNMYFLTEYGLYEVLMQSRKPLAKKFKKEVKKVIKQIRQTGGYIPIQENDDEMTILSKAVLIANKTIENKNIIIQNQKEKIEKLEPKAEYFDDMMNKENAFSITLIAKKYNMTANKLNKILKENKIQNKVGEAWVLNKKYDNKGYTITRMCKGKGFSKLGHMHTFWTIKGEKFIYDFLKEKYDLLPTKIKD